MYGPPHADTRQKLFSLRRVCLMNNQAAIKSSRVPDVCVVPDAGAVLQCSCSNLLFPTN